MSGMSLRLRLALAFTALTAVGLGGFGFAVTTAYSRSQMRSLDDQLISSVGAIEVRLFEAGATADLDDRDEDRREPPLSIAAGFVAQLLADDGTILAQIPDPADQPSSNPDLSELTVLPSVRDIFTTGSASGSGRWRVIAEPMARGDGRDDRHSAGSVVVIAVPLDSVTSSVNRLVAFQALGGAALLAVLGIGSALVLRRGLRPLEVMSAAARSISDGSLDQRVAPADEQTEIGRLGLALNTMLGGIESAFAQRDETEAKLRRFLSDASHELRTPLTSIQGFAELGRIGHDGRIDPRLAFARIEAESARMSRLVDDLLLLARLDEHPVMRRQPVDLSVIAADSATNARAVDREREVRLDVPEPIVIVGDPDLLRQAVGNLVTNALRHTPPGAAVEIATRRSGDQVELVVRDHGEGFPPDQLSRVFERFWQADQARVGEGAGLGLALVAAITEEHHGTAVAANHPTGGAEVTLRFPLASGDPGESR